MGSAMRKRHHWQEDKHALNQILYILNFIAVGYDMVLNTTHGRNAKTLFTLASHKRHHIPPPYGQAMGHPCETFGEDLPHTAPALWKASSSLQWRHNGRDAVWNHCRPECVFNRLLRCGPRNTSKLRVTGTCEGNSPVTGESIFLFLYFGGFCTF